VLQANNYDVKYRHLESEANKCTFENGKLLHSIRRGISIIRKMCDFLLGGYGDR